MHAAIHSIIETGLSGVVIDVECRLSNGLPAIVIVGYASKSIEEAKERIRGAFSSSQLQLPRKRIVLNLAPGDIPKQGTCFDLAMAAAILVAQGNIKFTLKNWMIIGELSLDGSVRPVRGIIGQIQAGRQLGYKKFLIPSKNLPQAQLVDGVSLFPVQDLLQLHAYLLGRVLVANRSTVAHSPVPRPHYPVDMQDIRGQRQAKRALEIAAAGGHNLLLSGPPGAGKSLLAQALPSILPLPTAEEVMTITHLHSLTSHQFSQINSRRPFRSPHHSISYNALVGGGQLAQPGEISLSHGGVLFLDELPEFNRAAIEALRQPLENKSITVSRTHQKVDYPANFTLVATANPCPCGYYGSTKTCQCLAYQRLRYLQRLSGPILDRIDLFVCVEEIDHRQLLKASSKDSSQAVQRRVQKAYQIQQVRSGQLNAGLDNAAVRRWCKLSVSTKATLDKLASQTHLSARVYMKTVKVARTIADLADCQQIKLEHVLEALRLRQEASYGA